MRFSSNFSRSAFRAILEIEHSTVPLKQSINHCTSLISDCSLNTTLDAPQSPSENNFSSPHYPLGFPMNMTCGWFIMAPENQTIKLQLTSRLSSSYKSSDRVEVYDVDGSELSANSLRLSNPHANTDTIYSKFRSLYILFKSDGHPQESLSESGIIVLYTAFETGEKDYLTTQECIIPKPFSFDYFPACGWIQVAWRDLVVFVSSLLTPTSCTKSEHRLYYTRLEVVGTRKNGRARRHACHTPRVSPSRAPVLPFTHYFQAPAMQARYGEMLPMPLPLVFDLS